MSSLTLFFSLVLTSLFSISQSFIPILLSGAPINKIKCSATNDVKISVANKVALVALGCPKNTVDAEVMLGDLQKRGFKIVSNPRDADVVIVNTCTFIEEAKKESVQAILEAVELKQSSAKGVVVTGCMAQRYAAELSNELPEVDAVVGFERYADIGKHIEDIVERSGMSMPVVAVGATDVRPTASQHLLPYTCFCACIPIVVSSAMARASAAGLHSSYKASCHHHHRLVGRGQVPFRPEWERVRLTQRHSAFIRVAEGCDHQCTFCAIPSWRGRLRSKAFEAVMEEATRLCLQGVTELNLIAEDTNQWGQDFGSADPRRLADLLHALAGLPQVRRIRLLYCYPSYFSDELIDAIASIDKVCKYIDMPLQHISDPVLRAMNRPPRAHAEALIRKLRERVEGLVLRTTFISGFPGETDDDHRQLAQFIRDQQFERAGIFAYSEEEGTPAATLPNQVPERVKERRRDELVSLVQKSQRAFARRQEGKTLEVLIDRVGEGGFGSLGRCRFDAPDIDCVVHLPESFPPGSYVQALVTGSYEFDLVAVAQPPTP